MDTETRIKINNPDDKFFRHVFGDIENAASFLKERL